MSETYRIFSNLIKENYNISELDESPLIRNDCSSYFTFSPFQDTQKNFHELVDSNDIYIKKQRTIRKLDSLDLSNPQNLNYQTTYAIQKYKRDNQLSLINYLIEKIRLTFFPQIKQNQIELTYPDTLDDYFLTLSSGYRLHKVSMSKKYFCDLGLNGNHYYIKVRMDYNGGAINVVDFVLVDYKQNHTSQLDSIWVEDLIDLLHENVKYIFYEKKYMSIRNVVEKFTNRPRDQHILLNDLRTIFKMIDLGVSPGAKGINSEVRRKIRKLFFYMHYYVNENINTLLELINDFGICTKQNKQNIKELILEIKNIDKNYNKSLNYVNKHHIGRIEAQNSFGVPNEFYGDYLKNSHSDYDF